MKWCDTERPNSWNKPCWWIFHLIPRYSTFNATLQLPTSIPMCLQNFRWLFCYLPILNNNKRDDHIYGASRYLANTLGTPLSGQNLSKYMDPPPSDNGRKRIGRVATFHCICQTNSIPHQYGHWSFCKVCQHLIHKGNMLHPTTCPTCGMNDSWETMPSMPNCSNYAS